MIMIQIEIHSIFSLVYNIKPMHLSCVSTQHQLLSYQDPTTFARHFDLSVMLLLQETGDLINLSSQAMHNSKTETVEKWKAKLRD